MLTAKIQIIEDDASYALELEMQLTELGYEVLPVVARPSEFTLDETNAPDLILADIFFGGKPEGIQVVAELQKRGIPVILITSSENDEVYEFAKTHFPSGYMIKPVQKITLKSLIEKALMSKDQLAAVNTVLDNWSKEQMIKRFFFVRHGKSLVKLVVENISLIEADGNYCYIHESGRRYVAKNSLRNFKSMLSNQGFLQINRGNLVNFRLIDQVNFSKSEIVVKGKLLTIGDAYREEVGEWLYRL